MPLQMASKWLLGVWWVPTEKESMLVRTDIATYLTHVGGLFYNV